MPWVDVLGVPAAWLRVAGTTLAVYVVVILLLRWTGNRTLASFRAFDFLLVVALGTLVASAALNQVPLGSALLALVLLVGLQVGVAALARRSRAVERLVTSEPVLVVRDGVLLEGGMRRARLTRADVLLGLRSKGYADVAEAGAVILEANGALSVLPRRGDASASALENVPQSRPRA